MSDPKSFNDPILPGAAIGILGSGQLGRMLALSARQMGYRVHVFSPDRETPAGQIADREVFAPYEDAKSIEWFAQAVDVITCEFENVPSATMDFAKQLDYAPVRPDGRVLFTTQNRMREKTFLQSRGFPVTPFAPVEFEEDIVRAIETVGLPAVLKTAGFGYDGKGQQIVRSEDEARQAFAANGGQFCIWEALVDFTCELSVVAARGLDGEFAAYPVAQNEHAHHILDVTVVPAPSVSPEIEKQVHDMARAILEALNVVGVLCVELFLTTTGDLLVNELAPRPHNSGHWTIEGAATSQFEQQLRAVCGLPLGDTALRADGVAMANLLGDLWESGPPDFARALALPDVHLHLYGKTEARTGRKMGHITALAATPSEAVEKVRAARAALTAR